MEEIAPSLYASAPHPLGFGEKPLFSRSYLIRRPQGNLLIYGADPVLGELEEIRRLGGVSRHYLNHSHEASKAAAQVREEFGNQLLVHEGDAAEVSEIVPVDETFRETGTLGDDFDLVPVPGHTPGATAFVWRGTGGTALFTGDTVFLRDGEWGAAFLDDISNRPDYVASLERLAGLEFDLLVHGIAREGEAGQVSTAGIDSKAILLGIAERLRAGGDR